MSFPNALPTTPTPVGRQAQQAWQQNQLSCSSYPPSPGPSSSWTPHLLPLPSATPPAEHMLARSANAQHVIREWVGGRPLRTVCDLDWAALRLAYTWAWTRPHRQTDGQTEWLTDSLPATGRPYSGGGRRCPQSLQHINTPKYRAKGPCVGVRPSTESIEGLAAIEGD